ncbi:hypothetical protein ACLB1R_04860 [Escherichia coli]
MVWAHLPPEIDSQLVHKLYYGHFMCYVFHQDYIVKKGVDVHAFGKNNLNCCHSVARNILPNITSVICIKHRRHLQKFYRENDPTNSMNPGIGKTSKRKNWQEVE